MYEWNDMGSGQQFANLQQSIQDRQAESQRAHDQYVNGTLKEMGLVFAIITILQMIFGGRQHQQ